MCLFYKTVLSITESAFKRFRLNIVGIVRSNNVESLSIVDTFDIAASHRITEMHPAEYTFP